MTQLHAVAAKAPASEVRTSSAAPAREPAQSSAQPLRVFLVEDSALYRERLVEYLEAGGALKVVGWADNEAAAVDALQRTAWDVAIVDVQLKQGTGLRVLRALHKKPRRPESRIVVLTNHDFYLYRRQAIEVGADLFFVKSRDFRHLAKVLSEMSNRKVASIRP